MTGQTNDIQWYIARDGKQHGPLTDIEMRTFIAHNYLRATDLIWRPGMAEWQASPSVFPEVFQQPQQPATGPATGGGPATGSASQPTTAPAGTQPTHGRPYEPAAPRYEQTHAPRTERSIGKRLAIAAVALCVIGGGAFALATYHEPLMQIVTGHGQSHNESEAPVVAASVPEENATPAETDNTSSVNAAPITTANIDTNSEPAANHQAPETASDASANAQAGTAVAAIAPDTTASPPPVDGSELDTRLQKIPVWALIKREYPDWYTNHISTANTLSAEGKSENEIAQHLAQGIVSLRRQNADKALAASAEKLQNIAQAFLDNLKALRAQSVSACYGYISKGEMSPAVVQLLERPEEATSINAHADAVFEAVSDGTRNPVQHDAAVKSDYDILIKQLSKLGWKDEDLQVFSDPKRLAKREPDQVCKMVQEWFIAHLSVQDSAVRERLLYETLKPVVSG